MCGCRQKPILELAGNDVVVVWSDANLDYASDALLEAFFGSGQLCMIPNLVVAHPDIAEDLIALAISKAASIRIDIPTKTVYSCRRCFVMTSSTVRSATPWTTGLNCWPAAAASMSTARRPSPECFCSPP